MDHEQTMGMSVSGDHCLFQDNGLERLHQTELMSTTGSCMVCSKFHMDRLVFLLNREHRNIKGMVARHDGGNDHRS